MGVVRVVLLVIAGLLIIGSITLVMLVVVPAGIALIGWGVLLLIGLLIERWRYKPLGERRPGPDWTARRALKLPARCLDCGSDAAVTC
jgi:hypothetical protein